MYAVYFYICILLIVGLFAYGLLRIVRLINSVQGENILKS